MHSKRIGKYACLEMERRYLLKTVPEDLPSGNAVWQITDRYFPDTRLRLRLMNAIDHDEKIYKLTQKYRAENQGASQTTITNIYLSESEYHCFEPLEARILIKMRYPYKLKNHIISIDVFEGRHQGLVLAEMEFESQAELDELDLSIGFRDVTEDLFFTGGNLAAMTDEEFKKGLALRIPSYFIDPPAR